MEDQIILKIAYNRFKNCITISNDSFEYNCFIDFISGNGDMQVNFQSGFLKEIKNLHICTTTKNISFTFEKIKDVFFEISTMKLIFFYYDVKHDKHVNIELPLDKSFEKTFTIDKNNLK